MVFTNGCRAVVWLVVNPGSLLFPSMGSLLQGLPRNSPEYILGTNLGKRLLVPVGQCQTWIAPKWCIKSDNGHCQVRQSCPCSLNVSSRVFWLELDDKALLDSYTVLQEGILCDVFSQKCSAPSRSKAYGRHYAAGPSRCR